jgi:hypothetical protein
MASPSASTGLANTSSNSNRNMLTKKSAPSTTNEPGLLTTPGGLKTLDPTTIPVTSSDPNPSDPTAPSKDVTSSRQRFSDLFTIFCAGFALISDGYQNSLMTMTNVVFGSLYGKAYTSALSTQVSNALLVGEIIGQITIG